MAAKPKSKEPRYTHKTMLYFSEEQWQRITALSEQTGAPVSELVRRAVDAYLIQFGKTKGAKLPPGFTPV